MTNPTWAFIVVFCSVFFYYLGGWVVLVRFIKSREENDE